MSKNEAKTIKRVADKRRNYKSPSWFWLKKVSSQNGFLVHLRKSVLTGKHAVFLASFCKTKEVSNYKL